MFISSIGSSIGLNALDRSALQARAEKIKAVAEKIIASLPGNGKAKPEPKPVNMERIASDIVQVSQTFNKKLQFVVDHRTHEVIVKVIDKTTDKVIKVLPPEELQRLHRKLQETIGYLLDEKV